MKTLLVTNILDQYRIKKYNLKTNPYEMNIFAIRTIDNQANTFNDYVGLIFRDEKNNWQLRLWSATTDAGLFYRLHPDNVNGTAIIVPGQYEGVYKVGLHKGYEAMEQIGNIKYIRDNNKNAVLDWIYNVVGAKYEIAINKTNIHHAGENSTQVDNWSAGCIVFSKITEFLSFMGLVKCSIDQYHFPNLFDLTLFEEKDFN